MVIAEKFTEYKLQSKRLVNLVRNKKAFTVLYRFTLLISPSLRLVSKMSNFLKATYC